MTRAGMAEALGVPESAVDELECTPGEVKIGIILKMCNILGITVQSLADGSAE